MFLDIPRYLTDSVAGIQKIDCNSAISVSANKNSSSAYIRIHTNYFRASTAYVRAASIYARDTTYATQ
jgi:hypothetical protein